MPLKVGDYVRFNCRCCEQCRHYADRKDLLILVETEGCCRMKYASDGKIFYEGYAFPLDAVIPEPFLGAAAEAIRKARETGCRS